MSFRNIFNKLGSAVKTGSNFLISGIKKSADLTARALGKIGSTGLDAASYLIPEKISNKWKTATELFGNIPITSAVRQELDETNQVTKVESNFKPLPPGFIEIDEPVPNGFVEYLLPDGKTVWRHTNQRLNDLIDNKLTSVNKSDAMTLTLQSDIGIPRRYIKRESPKAKATDTQGAWFPYLLKDEVPMDLQKYGIFKKHQIPKEVTNCLLNIFKDHPKFDTLASIHYGNYTNQSELKQICELLKVKIVLHKYRTELKRSVIFGDKNLPEESTYHIALSCNHYFKFEVTGYKSIWVKKASWKPENYKSTQVRATSPYINSLQLVIEIFKLKDIYLEDFGSEIYNLHYQSKFDIDINNPKFDLKAYCILSTEEKVKEEINEPYSDVFYADIETNNDGNHEPYMFCLVDENSDDRWCWKGSDCVEKALNKLKYCVRPLIYFHNLGYDSKFIVDKLINPSSIDISSSNCVSLTGQFGKSNLTFHDTFAFLSCGLASFSKMFDLEEGKYENFPHALYSRKDVTDKEEINLTPRIKKLIPTKYQNHITKTVRHMDYAEDYCIQDVLTLKNGFVIFKKWISDELKINVDYLLTAASLAHHYLKLQNCYEDVYKLGGVTRAYMQKAVIGGRTMISLDDKYQKVVKKCEEEVYDFDAVSLYPSAMIKMNGAPKGKPKIIKSEELSDSSLNLMDDYFATIKITKVGKKCKIPCMSKLGIDGSRIWTNEMEGETVVVNKTMLEDYVKFHKIEFEVICGLKFTEGFNTKIVETMKNIFELRKQLKNAKNPAEKVYKLIMNSAYGKTIEKQHNVKTKYVSKDKFSEFMRKKCGCVQEVYEMDNHFRIKYETGVSSHFTLPQVGCNVLAMSKRIMNEVFEVVEDDVYYTDTDSMFITKKGLDKLSPDIIGSNPLQFHVDFEMKGDNVRGVRALFLAPKTYCVQLTNDDGETDFHLRMKGLSKNAIDAKNEEFESPFHMFEKLLEESITYDLLAGDKVRFEFLGNLKVKNVKEFHRTIGPFKQ